VGTVQEDVVGGALVRRSQVGNITIGGRVGWVSPRGLGADVGFGLTPCQVARTDPSGTDDFPGLAVLATARVSQRVRLNGSFDGHFAAGAGVLRRSGAGWNGTTVAPAALIGYGLETPLAAGSAFRMEMELLGSRARRATVTGESSARWRADLIISFGFVMPSAPRRASRWRMAQ